MNFNKIRLYNLNSSGQALIFVLVMLLIVMYVVTAALVRRASNDTTTLGSLDSTHALTLAQSGIKDVENTLQQSNNPLYFTTTTYLSPSSSSVLTNDCKTFTLATPSSNCSYSAKVVPTSIGSYFASPGQSIMVNLDTDNPGDSCALTGCQIYVTANLPSGGPSSTEALITFGDFNNNAYPSQYVSLSTGVQKTISIPNSLNSIPASPIVPDYATISLSSTTGGTLNVSAR